MDKRTDLKCGVCGCETFIDSSDTISIWCCDECGTCGEYEQKASTMSEPDDRDEVWTVTGTHDSEVAPGLKAIELHRVDRNAWRCFIYSYEPPFSKLQHGDTITIHHADRRNADEHKEE